MFDDNSRMFKTIWRNLKRALITSPDIQNDLSTYNINSSNNLSDNLPSSSNASNDIIVLSNELATTNSTPDELGPPVKRQKLNIETNVKNISSSDENSFMEIMKNLLSCSICLEVNSYSNQCPNGHLICITCSGRLQQVSGDLNCPVCRVSLKQGLHRSLLAEQITSELPSSCKFCNKIMPVKAVKRHETEECTQRKVPCKYKLFGCDWSGINESLTEHVDYCPIADKTVGYLHDVIKANINKDVKLLNAPLQIWKNIICKIRGQAVGSRMLLRQTTLNKVKNDDDTSLISFKSPIVRVPFSCCHMHGFYLELRIKTTNENIEKLEYSLKSENKTKITLNYFLSTFKIDESINLEINDHLHNHHFESNHKESGFHEVQIVSLDCDKELPVISNFDNILVEVCFISERERSERSHGILSSSDEDDVTQMASGNSTDNNVLFTLFSPTTSGTRSMNSSNATIIGSEDTIITDVEASQEDDLIITVTDNVDNSDDVSAETREPSISRNNHSYIALPTVYYNPNPTMIPYTPFQLDNTIIPNLNYFQQIQPPINLVTQNRDNIESNIINAQNNGFYHIDQPDPEQYQPSMNQINFTQQLNPRVSESIQTNDSNRYNREPVHMSLFYPPQTIVRPYLSNSISPLTTIRPSIPRNIVVRPRSNTNQPPNIPPRSVNNTNETNISSNHSTQSIVESNDSYTDPQLISNEELDPL